MQAIARFSRNDAKKVDQFFRVPGEFNISQSAEFPKTLTPPPGKKGCREAFRREGWESRRKSELKFGVWGVTERKTQLRSLSIA